MIKRYLVVMTIVSCLVIQSQLQASRPAEPRSAQQAVQQYNEEQDLQRVIEESKRTSEQERVGREWRSGWSKVKEDVDLQIAIQRSQADLEEARRKKEVEADQELVMQQSRIRNLEAKLFTAIEANKPVWIKDLVEKKHVDVNALDTDEKTTALMYAIQHSKSNAALQLIALGADVNARGKNGRTPLMYSAIFSSGVIGAIVQRGANVNDRDDQGYTALWYAASASKPATFRNLLFGGGAKPDDAVRKLAADKPAIKKALDEYDAAEAEKKAQSEVVVAPGGPKK